MSLNIYAPRKYESQKAGWSYKDEENTWDNGIQEGWVWQGPLKIILLKSLLKAKSIKQVANDSVQLGWEHHWWQRSHIIWLSVVSDQFYSKTHPYV